MKPLNNENCFFSIQAEEDSGMDRMVLAQLTQLYMTVKLECPFYNVSDTRGISTSLTRALTHGKKFFYNINTF